MSTRNLHVFVSSPPAAASQSPAATPIVQRLLGIGRAAWHGLERVGQRRAARELELIARRYATSDPALARRLREASRFDIVQQEADPS